MRHNYLFPDYPAMGRTVWTLYWQNPDINPIQFEGSSPVYGICSKIQLSDTRYITFYPPSNQNSWQSDQDNINPIKSLPTNIPLS